jgi:hypothetical protein
MKSPAEPVLVGWTEYVDLPDWNVRRLRAKIDTGARSSALHVEDIVELPRDRIRFTVVLHREKQDRRIRVSARVRRRSRVRSSNGIVENRFFVRTTLVLGPVEREVELSLVNRGKMNHRMLLGRTALAGPFLIDVDRRMVLSTKKKKRSKKKTSKKVKKTGG